MRRLSILVKAAVLAATGVSLTQGNVSACSDTTSYWIDSSGQCADLSNLAQPSPLNAEVDAGQLDITPRPRSVNNFVGVSDPEDSFQFFLQAPSRVEFTLSELTQGANLILTDPLGNIIARSTNGGTQDELISEELEPGDYVVVVRSTKDNSTSYRLTARAVYLTDEIAIQFDQADITDPEFYGDDRAQVTWQDRSGNLWVAPVLPSGDFDLPQAQIVTDGLAPIPAPNGTGNGPEWGLTERGVGILYTALINGDFFLGLAEYINNAWTTSILPNSKFGHSPFGTFLSNDPKPLTAFFVGTPETRRQAIAWGSVAQPDDGGLVPFTRDDQGNTEGIRWVEGERSLVYVLPIDDIRQAVRYNVDTGQLAQLTTNQTQKGAVFMWQAPEYGGELLIMVKESEGPNSRLFSSVGIFRNIGGEWVRIKRIQPPSDLAEIRSPEPFTYQGKSYISMLVEDDKQDPSEVWIAGIDPEVEFYRQVSDPNLDNLVRNDPEPFETADGMFVYYAIRGRGVVVRANTGL